MAMMCRRPGNDKPRSELGPEDVDPLVSSLWLAVDDVTAENGPMEVGVLLRQPEERVHCA